MGSRCVARRELVLLRVRYPERSGLRKRSQGGTSAVLAPASLMNSKFYLPIADKRKDLSELLATVNAAEADERLAQYLRERPFPHYEPAEKPSQLAQIESNGPRTLGRFDQREFRPVGTL